MALALTLTTTGAHAAVFGWSGSGSGPGSGANTAWQTVGNWTNNSGLPGSADFVWFGSAGSGTSIGFNFNQPPAVGSTNIGAIVLGAGSTVDRTIGNSSGTASIATRLYLNGIGGGLITNAVSGRILTLAPFAGGSAVAMTNVLVNSGVIEAVGNVVISANIIEAGGARGLTKTGPGSLTLSGTNAYTGKTIVNAGTLVIPDENRLGNNPGASTADQLTLNGGTLQASASFTIDDGNRGITIGANNGTFNNNGQTITISRPIAGPGDITNTGSGTIIFNTTASTRTGRTVLRGGLTRPISGASFGALPGAPLADSIILDGGGILNQDSEFTLEANRGITVAAGGGRLQAGFARPWGVDGVITGSGVLTIAADTTPHVISLNGANTLTGDLIVNNSTAGNSALVAINGSIAPGARVRVTTNGWLLGTGTINREVIGTNGANISAGPLLAPGTLTINGNLSLTNANLVLDLAGTTTPGGGVNDLLQVNGDVNLSGTIIVRANAISPGGLLVPGTYRLIQYTGAFTGSSANLVLDGASYGYVATFDTDTEGEINMLVSLGPQTAVWRGAGGPINAPLWDVGVTPNFVVDGDTGVFRQGEAVLFDDTGIYTAGGLPVGITLLGENNAWGSLLPSSVTVDTTNNVTFNGSGTGKLGGGMSLVKKNTGVLALNTSSANFPNDYSGTTTVEGGILRAGYTRAFGATNAPTIATNGGTIDVNGQSLGAEPFVASGAGVNGAGAIINNGGGQNNALRYLTLAGNTTVGGVGRWDVRNYAQNNNWPTATMFGNGYSLIKTGANQISFVDVGDTDLGNITVEQGTLSFEGNSTLGQSSSSATVKNGATLFYWGSRVIHEKPITLENGARLFKDNGNLTNLATVTLFGGTSVVDVANNNGNIAALNGQVTGAGALQKNGAGILQLAGTNDYTGNTIVNAGTLDLRPTGSISNSPVIDVRSGAVLQVNNLPSGLSLASGQRLTGGGSVLGPVTADPGTSVAPGTSPGTLSVSSNLTLNGASLTFELNTATTEGGGVNDLITARDLALAGVNTVNIVPLSPLSAGPYTLFRYTNTPLTGSAANLNVTSSSRYTFTVDTSVANVVQVTSAGAAASLVWAGGALGSETLWDVNTTANWLNGILPENFFQGDSVTFSDTSIYTNISLVGALSPGNVTVNSAQDYTFGGAGELKSLGQLAKSGTGRLILAANNPELNAGITIDGGTLEIGAGGTSGSIGAGAPVTNNATLVFNRSDSNALANVIRGAGTLVKNGAGTLALAGNNGLTGPVLVNAGTVRVGHSNALGNVANTVTIAEGGQVDFAGVPNAAASYRKNFTAAGYGPDGRGAIINSGNSVTTLNGLSNFTMTADTALGNYGPDGDGGRFDIGAGYGQWDAGGFRLVKLGPGRTSVRVTNTMNLVEIVVSNGFIYAENADFTLGTNVTVYAGGNVGMYAATGVRRTNNPTITLEGGGISGGGQTANQGTNVWLGEIIVNKPSTLHAGIINGNADHLLAGPISGSGSLTVIGNNNRRFDLYGTNDSLSGGWNIGGGAIVRVNTNSSLGSGNITNLGTIEWFATNATTFAQAIAGAGVFRHTYGAGAATFSGFLQQGTINLQNGAFENPVTFDSSATVSASALVVGVTNFAPAMGSAKLNINGATVTVGNFFIGDQNTQTGMVAQTGGTVLLTNQFRLGHWPNNVSTYTLESGALTMLQDPTATPATSGASEVAGGFYIGIDGIGVFTQNGGTLTTPNMVLDNRPGTLLGGNVNTYELNGGTVTIGRWGITTAFPTNTYQINLGGGTVAASQSWTSGLRMTLTGNNGYTTFDPGANSITLNGPLSGAGGLLKDGTGALILNGTNTFGGEVTVNAGTLGGNGVIAASVLIDAPATLAPGTSIGVLTVNSDVALAGTTLMEVSRSGSTWTNDRLVTTAGTITCGGALVVTNIGQPLVGEVFDLFDGAMTGTFDSVFLPPLAVGLVWDTSNLYVDGTIAVVGPPTIVTAPVSQTVYEGDHVRFTAAAAGTPVIVTQWEKDGVPIPGETGNTLAFTNVALSDAGTYTYTATNGYGGVAASAVLTVLEATNLADGLLAYWKLDTTDGISTPDATTNGNHLYLTNMDAGNVVTGLRSNAFTFNGTDELLTRSYTNNAPLMAYQYQGYTVAAWVKGPLQSDRRVFSQSSTNSNNPLLNVGTHNTAANGAVDIFVRPDAGATLIDHQKTTAFAFDTNNWHHVALVDNNGVVTVYVDGVPSFTTNYTRGTLTLNTMAIGGIQRATATAWFNGQIDDMMLWRRALRSNEVVCVKNNSLEGPPVITQQPVDAAVACGGTATFAVAATSVAEISYQWYRGGTALAGATSATLNYTAGLPGGFSVVVSNCAGAVTSAVATLTVTNEPSLISPLGALAVGSETNQCGDLVLAGGAAYRWEIADAAAGPGAGWDIYHIVGDLDIQATSGNPFVVDVVSLNGGALGPAANFDNNANGLFLIATISGTVNGFDPNKFTVNDALFANDLAGGVFSFDSFSPSVRFTANRAPLANSVTNNRAPNASLKISIADLLAAGTSDADGDARALVSVSATSTNGVSLTTNGTFIFYSNPNNVEDEFSYTVRDVRAYRAGDTVRTATGTLRITVNAPAGTNQNFVSFAVVEGKPTMRFAGIPGYTYEVQRTTDLTPPTSWTTLHTTNAPSLGLFDFVDDNPPVGQAYYRAVQP